MSLIPHLVVSNAEHLRTQLIDANRLPETDVIYEGIGLLTQQLSDRARLLICMGKSA